MTRKFAFVLAVSVASVATLPGHAETLKDELATLVDTHKRVEAARADLQASKETAKVSEAAWYPTVDTTTSYGWEEQSKGQGTEDTNLMPRVLEVSVSQLVWDFGATDAAIDRSRIEVLQSQQSLESTRQSILLEGINAHLNVVRQRQLLEFNNGSIENVKRQMQLEDARVARGSGLATDVLQAKSQLAGLEATRTRIQGALRNAINRYRAVFGDNPPDAGERRAKKLPKLPLELLPATMEEAIKIAGEENPRLKSTYLGTLIAQRNVDETEASEFYPAINASAERNLKKDEGGTVGGKQESLVKIEMTYSFDAMFTKRNTLRAAELNQQAGLSRFNEDRDLVEERIRNAWDDLETARLRVEQLENQANIASEFLELARKERQLGNRSLIDVLAGETALINATSDAASAKIDVAQAVFRLLNAMGRLSTEAIRQ